MPQKKGTGLSSISKHFLGNEKMRGNGHLNGLMSEVKKELRSSKPTSKC
jgi:hypothetical protein